MILTIERTLEEPVGIVKIAEDPPAEPEPYKGLYPEAEVSGTEAWNTRVEHEARAGLVEKIHGSLDLASR